MNRFVYLHHISAKLCISPQVKCRIDAGFCVVGTERRFLSRKWIVFRYFVRVSVCHCSLLSCFLFILIDQGESVSSETSNGYVHEAEGTWQAFDEEADTQSTQSTHMDVTTDPPSQGSLLLSHSEALAGTTTYGEAE